MDIEKRLELVKQVGEEIITETELRGLLETKQRPVAYDGFEPSGRVHIAQGIMRALNINKIASAGISFKMLVADWHGWANNKMEGNLEKIQVVGKYMIEVWKASGMNLSKVKFVWANELIKETEYWKKVMEVARHTTVSRIVRCAQIMGRNEKETLQSSQIFYPCMQCADIFHLGADITQLGMDQRKVNVLAREIARPLGYWKPVVVSHHMLMGLGQPPAVGGSATERAVDLKMSKSRPDSAIFMTDSEEEVNRKINMSYCPLTIHENPVMEYARYIVFEKFDSLALDLSLSVISFCNLIFLFSTNSGLTKDFVLSAQIP